ncbi:MAG: beta-aspartyl-peptidase [Desulfobacterales bacterium]|nr:beta-aspartyl-peptidase [Desulfobacterales bacterium]
MILIQNATVYSPHPLGKLDVLVGGGQILALEPRLDPKCIPGEIHTVDASGTALVPGFIDGHQHFTGGGGEGGFHTRAPEMQLSMNVGAGVTTALGLLGTDGITRNLESLYAKTRAFNTEGITAFMVTGSYWLPSPTLCGSVGRDMTFMDPVLGVKLAMADHRGPHYDAKELARLAAEVGNAAMVPGKPGIMVIHTGAEPQGLDPIFEAMEMAPIPARRFCPTHINRKKGKAMGQALELADKGAIIDATATPETQGDSPAFATAADLAILARDNGLFDQVSFSSDAGGSMPRWNADHSELIGLDVCRPDTLLLEFHRLVHDKGLEPGDALIPLTQTPARLLGLEKTKGTISPGAHADLLLLDPHTLTLESVMAKGQWLMGRGEILKRGYFE